MTDVVGTVRRREERFNSKLADALVRRGVDAEAEVIAQHGATKKLPDVQLRWAGLPMVLECKFDESTTARVQVEQQARERLAQAFGSIAVALLYPVSLRSVRDIDAGLDRAELRIKLFAPGQCSRDWIEVIGVAGLAEALDKAREQLADDDLVDESVALLQEAVDSFARAASHQVGRVDDLLSIVTVEDAAGAGQGNEKAKAAAVRICGLAVTTAALLQVELSRFDPAVPPIPDPSTSEVRSALIASWRRILDHDYAAVFRLAVTVLEHLTDADASLAQALSRVIAIAHEVTKRQVVGRHDLIGRIYHTLLADKKYLATYFTSVPAATLLATVALDPGRWPDVAWDADPDDFAMQVGDLACGTGTLLAAALSTIRHFWVSARASKGSDVDLEALGRRMIEDNLWGFDVLAYAVQVCAATLLLSSPGSVVTRTRLYQMPFGGAEGRLGTLELLVGETQAALFGDATHLHVGLDANLSPTVSLSGPPELDLVVMNPPFTRSVGGSQLLGSLKGAEHKKAREALATLISRPDIAGDLNAGLAAPFIELAHRSVRPGGRLALVLPKTVLTGESWAQTRERIASNWHVEHVISSHEAGRWNFSDSTALSEAIIIARKWKADDDRSGAQTVWTALWRNPPTSIDALAIASALRHAKPVPSGAPIQVGEGLDAVVGEMFSRPAPTSGAPWRHATFSRSVLDCVAEALLNGEPARLPRVSTAVSIPLVRIEDIGIVGPDRARIHDGFRRTAAAAPYRVLWGHDSSEIQALGQSADGYLDAAPGREDYAAKLWNGAARLMVAERFRLNTHRCVAIRLEERALANTFWPVTLASGSPEDERILALWLNSTLGLMSFIGASEETEGPLVAIKKNKLRELRVIDTKALGPTARAQLLEEWQSVEGSSLQPLTLLAHDPVRACIDRAFCTAIGISPDPIDALREMLENEPRLGKPTPRHSARRAGRTSDDQQLLFPA